MLARKTSVLSLVPQKSLDMPSPSSPTPPESLAPRGDYVAVSFLTPEDPDILCSGSVPVSDYAMNLSI